MEMKVPVIFAKKLLKQHNVDLEEELNEEKIDLSEIS